MQRPTGYLKDIPMKLREHPLISYRDLRSWPPVWTWVGGAGTTKPKGEVGVLREVRLSSIEPADRIFLYMNHTGAEYLGCLLVDDHAFCRQIANVLEEHCGQPISDIGGLDISSTL